MQEEKNIPFFKNLLSTPHNALKAHINLKEAILQVPNLLTSTLELLTNIE